MVDEEKSPCRRMACSGVFLGIFGEKIRIIILENTFEKQPQPVYNQFEQAQAMSQRLKFVS